ncbi:hypothetical protein [Paragemmobacter aquarius]|uniref:hypothetical protein n=1 Tax=Paragemmobacter aquarius TaxID=2169400 RepID=UPI00131EE70B|nr:hypothetical protein [Gemmobacter aquarius]
MTDFDADQQKPAAGAICGATKRRGGAAGERRGDFSAKNQALGERAVTLRVRAGRGGAGRGEVGRGEVGTGGAPPACGGGGLGPWFA